MWGLPVERQARLADLIAEVRHLEEIQAPETRVNRDLLDALVLDEWAGFWAKVLDQS